MRRNMRLFGVSTAVFLLPALAAFILTIQNVASVEYMMGAGFLEMVYERIEEGHAVPGVHGEEMAVVSAAVTTNNIQVSMLCFAGGALLGTLTLYALFTNGLMLGSFAGLFHMEDMGGLMWTTILPHGIPELTAIVLSGMAGLRLAAGILLPGRLPRRRHPAREPLRRRTLLVIARLDRAIQ